MRSEEFDYELPQSAIAQQPADPRDSSRLLVAGDPLRHLLTSEFASLLGPGDVLVLNDTKVLPARLLLNKPTGGAVEVLALAPVGADGQWWEALVKPSRRVPDNCVLGIGDGPPLLEVGPPTGTGTRWVRALSGTMQALMSSVGTVPLPPYISGYDSDMGRYQTVYARRESSVAAPTAGLHLTSATLAACKSAGARVVTVELSVGVDTFRPLETETLDQHQMHSEQYQIPAESWQIIQDAQRVVAVGTTVVRTLESAALSGELDASTDLFITPGFSFSLVGALLTNFHMPRSTLLVMIEAFMGPQWRSVYQSALADGYGFLSFGDAMFAERVGP